MSSKKNNPQPQAQPSPPPPVNDDNSGYIRPRNNLPSLKLTPTTSLITADSPRIQQHGIQVYTGEDHNHGVRPANGNISVSVSGPGWIIAMSMGYIKFLSKISGRNVSMVLVRDELLRERT